MAWHAGVVSTLPLAPRAIPFYADVGPGADGPPTAALTRAACASPSTHGGSMSVWRDASGCRLFEFVLGDQRASPAHCGAARAARCVGHGSGDLARS